MQRVRLTGGLLFGVLLVSAANLSAQDRRSSAARRAAERADSVRRVHEQGRDSARLRNPTEVRRQREDVQKERQQALDDARRGIPAGERATPRTVITRGSPNAGPDTTAVAPAGQPDRAGVLRIIETTSDSVRDDPPRRNRPRAMIMRLTDRDEAPMFCQNGSGHPVYGRDWCWERGFRLGAEWRRERVGDVPLTRVARGTRIDRALLEQMLGTDLIERIEDGRTELQLEQPLSGSWVESPTGGLILRIQAGDQPIAEVADRDRDGTIDSLWRRVRR